MSTPLGDEIDRLREQITVLTREAEMGKSMTGAGLGEIGRLKGELAKTHWLKEQAEQQLADANEMIARLRRQAEVITTRLEREADMMVCPRCGDSCSEDDFIENPENFFSCPMCGSMQHTKCRGPMTVGQEVEKLAEREQHWAGEALKRSIKLQISESQYERVQATIKVLRQELKETIGQRDRALRKLAEIERQKRPCRELPRQTGRSEN